MASTADILLGERRSGSMGHRTAALVAAVLLLGSPWLSSHLPSFLVDYPSAYFLPLASWVGHALTWLAREASIGGFTVSKITRELALLLEWPIRALTTVLNTGLSAGTGENVRRVIPPLSWLTVIGLTTIGTWAIGGKRLATTAAGGALYLLLFGLWSDAMATLASVLVATVFAIVAGLWLGTQAYKRPSLKGPIEAVMNAMQTVPVFAYLVPTLLFLGYGPSAALVATAIYAIPPMVHATVLGLETISPEILECGAMAGTTKRQQYWLVMLPSAIPFIGVGINQAIMASLNMVIISSMIGAGGLGYLVLVALRRLDIGAALEAGMGIVVLAIILDGATQSFARTFSGGVRARMKCPLSYMLGVWLVASTVAAVAIPALQDWPASLTLTTAPLWNHLISWINITFFVPLDAFRTFCLLYIMNPLKNFLLGLPWIVVVGLVSFTGYRIGGKRVAFFVAAMLSFILLTGFWKPAVVSIYLVALGVIICLIIGLPIGYFAALRPRARRLTGLVLDTLQTLPTLVYIIPAVMLFRNGDFSAVLAIASYAVAATVRYAVLAFSSVPPDRVEAALMSGATPYQTLKWIRLPHAVPSLILGLNQTLMMAIAMLVITALVGTRDLGQQVFIALSRLDVGNGIIGGFAVAALALMLDALLKAWAQQSALRTHMAASAG